MSDGKARLLPVSASGGAAKDLSEARVFPNTARAHQRGTAVTSSTACRPRQSYLCEEEEVDSARACLRELRMHKRCNGLVEGISR